MSPNLPDLHIPRVRRWPISKTMRLVFFIIGICVSASSWFVDNAIAFKPVLTLLAPKYVYLKQLFDELDRNQNARFPISHSGSKLLIASWDPAPPEELVRQTRFIGRDGGHISSNRGYYYNLRLLVGLDGSKYANDYQWDSREAKGLLEKEMGPLLRSKFLLLLCGLVVSSVTGLWEFVGNSGEFLGHDT